MHALVTGAGGFIGQALVQRLLFDAAALPAPLTCLTLVDQAFGPAAATWAADVRVNLHEGDFADPALLDRALSTRPDLVFHLASVPGSRAEREPELGLRVNLLSTIALFERLAQYTEQAAPTRVVFASSVAVYGDLAALGPVVHETALARPAISYGAHKRMSEILLADLSRTGRLDGVSLRLPGIVARPLSPTGHGSAFMSDLIRCVVAGEPYDCPVSSAAQAWWMSLPCCIDNLLHAARLAEPGRADERTVQLPVLTATVAEVVHAAELVQVQVSETKGVTSQAADVRWQPNEQIEALFGRMPRLESPNARALGFTDDGSLARLVRQALALDNAASTFIATPAQRH